MIRSIYVRSDTFAISQLANERDIPYFFEVFIFRPLKNKSLAILWSGQVFSSIGDEIYKVALIWMAASLLGPKAGNIAALQFGAVFFFGLLGGKWVDRLSPFRTMLTSDLVRAFVVLIPPVFYFYFGPQLWLLCIVAVCIAGLSAFFDPALQTCLVHLAPDRKLLQATNGLFDSTKRFARILGPGIVALLSIWFTTIQFFVIDALSFFASALSIALLASKLKSVHTKKSSDEKDSILKNLCDTCMLVFKSPYSMMRTLTSAWGWAMWYLALGLALPLYLNSELHSQIDTYAYVLTAYGFGNVISNFYFAGFETRYAARMMFGGAGLVGLGMFLMPASSSTLWMMAMAAFAAFGGPMDDLFLIRSLQSEYSLHEMSRVIRFLMTISQGLTLVAFLISPFLFSVVSPRWVLAGAGLSMFLPNLVSLIRFRSEKLQELH